MNAIRALLSGRAVSSDLWIALLGCTAILVAACLTATVLFHRRSRIS